MGLTRYLQSWWANAIYARTILNLQVSDATSGFRCWHVGALRGIHLDAIVSNGYSFQIEMAYVAEKSNYRIVEIPIYFEQRRLGRTKLNWQAKIGAAARVWDMRWRYRDFSAAGRQSQIPNGVGTENRTKPDEQ